MNHRETKQLEYLLWSVRRLDASENVMTLPKKQDFDFKSPLFYVLGKKELPEYLIQEKLVVYANYGNQSYAVFLTEHGMDYLQTYSEFLFDV